MTQTEKRNVFLIGLIMTFRMLGLFMVLPIFAVAAQHLQGATPTLIGVGLGIYGLTQALFQIPFGIFSDRIGRKSIIVIGLVLFAIGSIIAALAHSIEGMILGRAIQGMGAVGSVLLALAADLTTEEDRTKAMAIMGAVIGISFALAFVAGPAVSHVWGMSGIFWLTAFFSILGVILLFAFVSPVEKPVPLLVSWRTQLFKTIAHAELIRLNISIFTQHFVLTLLFVAVPVLLVQNLHFSSSTQIYFYLSILFLAFIAMVPLIILAEKYKKMRFVFILSVVLMTISQLGLSFLSQKIFLVAVLLWIFFTGFTVLEALLPSLVSKAAPKESKGVAMGVYSTSQFLGIFLGGSVGGLIFTHFALQGVLIAGAVLCFIWSIAVQVRSR